MMTYFSVPFADKFQWENYLNAVRRHDGTFLNQFMGVGDVTTMAAGRGRRKPRTPCILTV